MFGHQDEIATPAKGRFFPISFENASRISRTLAFAAPKGKPRPGIRLLNPKRNSNLGIQVAAYFPAEELVLFSFPDTLDPAPARASVEAALQQLAELSRGIQPVENRPEVISFRAYLGAEHRLVITRRSRRFTRAKYRGRDKFTHAGKPQGAKTDERVLRSLHIT